MLEGTLTSNVRFVRAQNIMDKNGRDYDLITGEPKQDVRKFVPEKLKDQVADRVAIRRAG